MLFLSPAVAASPAAFPPYHLQPTHFFPQSQSSDSVCDYNELESYILEHNIKSKRSELKENNTSIRIGIWARSRPTAGSPRHVSDPLIVRAVLPDVAVIFVGLRHHPTELRARPLSVESVVAFGPRERVC